MDDERDFIAEKRVDLRRRVEKGSADKGGNKALVGGGVIVLILVFMGYGFVVGLRNPAIRNDTSAKPINGPQVSITFTTAPPTTTAAPITTPPPTTQAPTTTPPPTTTAAPITTPPPTTQAPTTTPPTTQAPTTPPPTTPPPTMGDLITLEPFAVTLNSFESFVSVLKGSGNNRKEYIYSKIEISVKNMDEKERYLRFTPTSVLVDDISNQYMAISSGKSDEFKSGVIYSGVEKTGSIYFDPNIKFQTKKLTLHLYVNGKKYLFVFKRY